MLVFPQLTTGAAALYPVIKQGLQRTVVNVLADGSRVVYADSDGAVAGWSLRATGLTLAEWNAIESLFQQTSGMSGTFTFLDPVGNLLLQSENFSAGAWTVGALVQLTGGIADPFGTTRATLLVNTGQAAAGLTQMLNVPGDFQYCLSVWVRSSSGSAVTLAVANTSKSFAAGMQWRRVYFSSNPGQAGATTVTFGAQVAAGASVEVFGMQAEAQPGPSDYKMTGTAGGVYPKARFGSDQITVTAQGTDVYDAMIQIVSTES
ncbi:MAG TPA: hypothetical protein VL127_00770 [Bryobacteraceae bacterium]|nr:hypothetical protein [Bryobacteraceae bacterium]